MVIIKALIKDMNTKILSGYIEKYLLPFVKEYQEKFVPDVCSEGFGFTYDTDSVTIYVDFRKIRQVDGFSFNCNSSSISIKNVEFIISSFLKEIHLDGLYDNQTLRSIPENNTESALSIKLSVGQKEVITETDFAELTERIKIYLSKLIFPYLDKYDSLEGMGNVLNVMTVREMLTYFGGSFPVPYFKAIYIAYRTANYTRYEDIKAEMPAWFEKMSKNERYAADRSKYENAYNVFVNILENGTLPTVASNM